MRVLVIPDIHLKPWIFDLADDIMLSGKADTAVCLMDIPDDWDMQMETQRYRETYDRAIRFAKDHPNTRWCYGNHDVSYPWGRLESGYSPYAESIVINKLEELENSLPEPSWIAVVHRIDNVLFSHGGLSQEFVFRLDEGMMEADIDTVLVAVNHAPRTFLWNDESPLWLRPQYRNVLAFRKDWYTQVVGHTPVDQVYERNGFISTDVFSTYRDGTQIGTSEFLIIDSVTEKWETLPAEYAKEDTAPLKTDSMCPLSRDEMLEILKNSRECEDRGDYEDFDKALDEISKNYDV